MLNFLLQTFQKTSKKTIFKNWKSHSTFLFNNEHCEWNWINIKNGSTAIFFVVSRSKIKKLKEKEVP